MQLAEICPFVRFAMGNIHPLITHKITTIDNRLFFVTNGGGEVLIDNQPFEIKENTLMLWQGGTEYKFILNKDFKAISINFDYTYENSHIVKPIPVINAETSKTQISQINFDDYPCLNNPIIINDAASVLPSLEKIIEIFSANLPLSTARLSAILKTCIADIVYLYTVKHTSSITYKKIKKVIDYIKEHYSENLTNEALAKLVNYHPYYLNRIMVMTTGSTIHQFLIDYRLTESEKLLISTDKSISDIGFAVGFSNTVSFITNFKRKHNITPAKFRINMQHIF